MKPKNSSKSKMFLYDQTAWIYDQRYREIQEEKYRSIFSRITLKKGELTLDAGCGTGLLLEKFSSKQRVIGIDFSMEMIRIAKNRIRNSNLIQADLNSLPFKDKTFSKVFGVTVLQNLKRPQKAVKEIARIIQKRGLVILSTLSKRANRKKIRELIEKEGLKEKEIYEVSEDIVIIAHKNAPSIE
ncbi:MAG: class I SAM-dependent methyltransferase [Candidatus Jordarchaeum sp.]|uniref:class I SAM-dependent methyltransferase n=1 Tax=Candidatus Jordarchaeum sp. TaxID=2823881 RepID=UPI004048EF42